ncbi:MAG: NosD domain-containing protein [Candidatus Bathyarchaeia archaeon]
MKLKTFLIAIRAFLLVGALIATIKVEYAKADGTIYIRPDGFVYPSTAPINRYGDVYTLIDNIINSSIVVLRDNIVLDGAGIYRIEGPPEYPSKGIDLTGRNNVTIRNMEIRSFYFGIFLNMTANIRINGIVANRTGIYGWDSSAIIIHGNNFPRGYIDINYYCSNIIASENMISDGIISVGSNSTIYRNVVSGGFIDVGSDNIVCENNVTNSWADGISMGSRNEVFRNNVANNSRYGIHVWWDGKYNIIYNNNIVNNSWAGIYLDRADENAIFHNNFINNGNNAIADPEADLNLFDAGYPAGGNYWSDYAGVDEKSGRYQDQLGSDGIGDTPYIIPEYGIGVPEHSDNYPLMGPINIFEAGIWGETEYFVEVVSNSTVSGFYFNPAEGPFMKFNVSGVTGTGFCRVAIPKDLLWVEDGQWNILVNNQPTNYMLFENEDFNYLYFTYNHSTKTVLVQGTNVIPESPTAALLLAFLVITVIPAVLIKKKHTRKTTI